MKKISKYPIRLMTVLAITGAGFLVFDNKVVTAETNYSFETHSESFSFTVTVVDTNGKVLPGKKVSLRDVTDANHTQTLPEIETNDKGQVVFPKLPLNRNFNVIVEGINQGYTVRTGVSGSKLAASFTTPGTGTLEPTFTEKPAVIVVRDEEGEPLAKQEVVLKTKEGREVGKIMTGSDGVASFVGNLMDGMMYTYIINGEITGQIMPGNSLSAYINTASFSDDPTQPAPSIPETGTFRFVVTILDKNGKVLEGKSVSLTDITDGSPIDLGNQVSNADGQAIFEHLPILRNISVSVEGESKGYTVRAGQAKTTKAASFFAEGTGTKEPSYTDIPLVITVRNEEGEPLANQEVSLTNALGQLVSTVVTDHQGKAVFADKLMEGMFYDFSVNGIKMHAVTPGNDISAYLTSYQIRKQNTPTGPSSSNPVESSSGTSQSSSSALASTSQKTTPLESADTGNQTRKVLPATGSKEYKVMTVIGVALAAVAIFLFKKENVKD
ncbi:LPXTG cell wall anchor domain-containing protein [Streptococcus cameli]